MLAIEVRQSSVALLSFPTIEVGHAMMEVLITVCWVQSELIDSMQEIQQHFFPNQKELDLQVVCEELVKPLDGWWKPHNVNDSMILFQSLVKCNIAERLNVIGVRKWRMEIKQSVEGLPSPDSSCFEGHFDSIHSKLATYELEYPKLKNAAFLLELALWKSKIDEQMVDDTNDWRGQCLINCGGDVIVPNVLPYLISNVQREL